ncbi:MAG: hypothetical protein GF350_08735 [Chitinivibrionales bacterium]|nr:hypothetical protein [Chitinivibrionales bacterium]
MISKKAVHRSARHFTPALTFVLVLLLFFAIVKAAQIATTGDGKKVLLKKDGTWKYATQSDIMAVKMLQSKAKSGQSAGKDPFGFSAKDVNAPHGRQKQAGKTKKAGGSGKGSGKTPVSLTRVIHPGAGFDFRKARWGMTKAQVKPSETAKLTKETANTLQYASKIAGMTSKMTYHFTSGKLTKASYDINQGHVNPSLFYEDFENLMDHMSSAYGTPATRDYQWKNTMYKNDKSKWGFAISIGFLTCNVIWKTQRSKINLHISGGKHTFITKIDYSQI